MIKFTHLNPSNLLSLIRYVSEAFAGWKMVPFWFCMYMRIEKRHNGQSISTNVSHRRIWDRKFFQSNNRTFPNSVMCFVCLKIDDGIIFIGLWKQKVSLFIIKFKLTINIFSLIRNYFTFNLLLNASDVESRTNNIFNEYLISVWNLVLIQFNSVKNRENWVLS